MFHRRLLIGFLNMSLGSTVQKKSKRLLFFFFLNVIHSMQDWTATTRHGVTRKGSTKRLQHIGNPQLKDLMSVNSRLKLVSAIFHQILIFSPNDSPPKTMTSVFHLSKKLFSFSRYSNFCNFFPSFEHFPDTKG